MMRLRRIHLFAAFGVVSAFVACTLNPQPLPPIVDPNDDNAAGPGGGFVTRDGGAPLDDEAPDSDSGNRDASAPPADADGGDAGNDDAGDAGDAGDASDAEVD